jgi:hypothetical protein
MMVINFVFKSLIHVQDRGLPECDAVSLYEWFPTYQGNVVPSPSRVNSSIS